MSRDDIQKLLGGYATGTLTPEEQQALFAAALDDQELFDSLAREQSLRDLLRDPAAKAHLLTALDEKPAPWWATWWKPAGLATAMAAVALLAVTVIRNGPTVPERATVAVAKPQGSEAAAEAPVQAREAPQSSDLAMATPKETESAPLRRKDKAAKPDGFGAELKLRDERAAAVAPKAAPPPATPRATAEKDAVTVTSARETGAGGRSGIVVGGAGVAPPPPSAAPPPAPKVEAIQSSANAVLEARTRVGARTLFLGQIQTNEMMKSSYADTKEQQAQFKQQAPAPSQQQQQIQSQRSNAQTLASQAFALQPPQPAARYSILTASGRPQVRIETNDDGYISVMARSDSGTWRTVSSLMIARMTPHVTIPLRPDEKELYISFSRQVQIAKGGPYTPEPGLDLSTNLTETEGSLTYVANPLQGAAGRELRFTIRLP